MIAWHPATAYGAFAGTPVVPASSVADLEDNARRVLAEALKDAAPDPGVPIRPVVAQGHAAAVLLHAAKDADLLVGNRGHGGLSSALVGSVSMHCVQQARGLVLAVRDQHAYRRNRR